MAAVNYVALGTWATVAAVAIALFGPPIQEWYRRKRRQPELHIIQKDLAVGLDPTQRTINIEIKNAEDRDRAENVEAFITIHTDESFDLFPEHSEVPTVAVEKGTLLLDGQQVSSINPGFGRSIELATVKCPEEPVKGAECGQWNAAFAGLGRNPAYRAPLRINVRYKLEVVVTGSNFNAAHFHGQATVDMTAIPGGREKLLFFVWTEEFTPGLSTESGWRPRPGPNHHA